MADSRKPPLADVRVLDASRVLAGPFCAQAPGALGPAAIKGAGPGRGREPRRGGPPSLAPLSAYFLPGNRNKRAVPLALPRPEGAELLHGRARHSDVLLENFRADSAA